ncbi:MAG: hypothetical protein KGL09_01075 [Pseudomonadota bacterium]|jgi:hypothetical protein|nr:hypothetical protein [Pseudomonadota bacterium]
MTPEEMTELRDAIASLVLPHITSLQKVLADAMGRMQAVELLAMALAHAHPQRDAVLAAFASGTEATLQDLAKRRSDATAPFLDSLRDHALRIQLALERPEGQT